jgi:hypothetical protein
MKRKRTRTIASVKKKWRKRSKAMIMSIPMMILTMMVTLLSKRMDHERGGGLVTMPDCFYKVWVTKIAVA